MQNNQNKGSYFQPAFLGDQSPLAELNEFEQKRNAQKSEIIKAGLLIGGAILGYLIVQTIASTVFLKGDFKDLYESSAIFSNTFNMLAVHFAALFLPFTIMAFILRKQFITPIIPTKKQPKSLIFAWTGLGMALCVFANYFVGIIITICESLGYKLTQGEVAKPDSVLACITCVFATAIVPPLFEEFAMRCCTLGVLRKYGTGFAVLTVSVVFGLLHGNVIQFIFAFLIGLVLAIVTVRTENILPAVLIHAFNNGISAFSDVTEYIIDKELDNLFLVGIYLFWLAMGVIGLIYLLYKKELFPPKQEKKPREPHELSFGSKFLCLLPGFALPILMLVLITISTIKKI